MNSTGFGFHNLIDLTESTLIHFRVLFCILICLIEKHKENTMIKLFKSPRFQLWLNLLFGLASLALIAVALSFDLLDSVKFVSWLSLLALVYGSLSGISAALVYIDQTTGFTLNQADKEWIKNVLDESKKN